MKKTIYKYALNIDINNIEVMGVNFKPIAFQLQNNVPTLWAEVNPSQVRTSKAVVSVIGTGWEVPQNGKYIGTCQQNGLVWHAYLIEN